MSFQSTSSNQGRANFSFVKDTSPSQSRKHFDAQDDDEDNLSDSVLERAYIDDVRQKSRLKSLVTSVGGGILIGCAAAPISLMIAAPVALIGATATWKFHRGIERERLAQTRRSLAAADHDSDDGGIETDINGASEILYVKLRRLKFLVKWGKLRIGELLDDFEIEKNADLKIQRIIDEVVSTFSPWIQRVYISRSNVNKDSTSADDRQIRMHLAPLYRFLRSERVIVAFGISELSFESDFFRGCCTDERALKRIRVVFPVIQETINLFEPSTASPSSRRQQQSEIASTADILQLISTFLARPEAIQYVNQGKRLNIETSNRINSDDESEESDGDEEVPPMGVEEEDEFFSASEGEEFETHGIKKVSSGKRPNQEEGDFNEDFSLRWSDNDKVVHTWNAVDCTFWKVRSETYFSTKLKLPSSPAIMQTLSVDLFHSDDPVSCCSQNSNCRANQLLTERPDWFFFTVNWRFSPLQVAVTWGIHINKLDGFLGLKRFLSADSVDRNSKLKVIPNVVEGPWLARKACGQTPAIIGKKLKTEYFYEEGKYIEAEIDVFSSSTAKAMLKVLVGAAKKLVIDVGLLIEAQEEDELPERLIGGFRVRHIDLSRCRRLYCKGHE